jgi:heme exporter protein C
MARLTTSLQQNRLPLVTGRELPLLLSAGSIMVSLVLIFFWVPTEINQGVVQRIMYLHVPVALASLAIFGFLFVTSAVYLWKRSPRWDAMSYASAEVGVLALTMTIVTGAIWAKPIWNAWWTWEPMLTTLLILWLMGVAYLALRAYSPPGERGARSAAVLGVLAGLTAPFVYFSVELWGNLAHPEKVIGPGRSSDSEIGALIGLTLMVSMLSFALFFGAIMVHRYKLRRSEDDVDALHLFNMQRRGSRP